MIALIRPEGESGTEYKTGWADHLEAIRQGTRVLLDLHITKAYTYEVTLDDGSTTTYRIGAGGTADELAESLRQQAAVMAGKDP